MSKVLVDRKVLDQVKTALERGAIRFEAPSFYTQAIKDLRIALEQPEQEPVAIVSSVTEPGQYGVKIRWLGGFPQIAMKLYTHSPSRDWQGLTQEEAKYMAYEVDANGGSVIEFARAIEVKLKEKNYA